VSCQEAVQVGTAQAVVVIITDPGRPRSWWGMGRRQGVLRSDRGVLSPFTFCDLTLASI
jgi:hypothetical protein